MKRKNGSRKPPNQKTVPKVAGAVTLVIVVGLALAVLAGTVVVNFGGTVTIHSDRTANLPSK